MVNKLPGWVDKLASRMDAMYSDNFVLVFLTFVNFLNYYDRGLLSGGLTTIGRSLHLPEGSDGEALGALGSGFMVGFMVFSPIFARAATVYRPTYLMAIGLSIWTVATMICGLATSYTSLLIGRILTGVGEASFAGLCPTVIDDTASSLTRTSWLSAFFGMIPVGQAGGVALAGVFITATGGNWNLMFVTEALIMIPCVIITIFIPERYSSGSNKRRRMSSVKFIPQETIQEHEALSDIENELELAAETGVDVSMMGAIKSLAKNPYYMLTVMGYSSFTFVIGALAIWGPSYVQTQFASSFGGREDAANSAIGLVSVLAGLLGVAGGGITVDKMGGSKGFDGASRALRLSYILVFISIPITMAAFASTNVFVFFGLVFIGELCIFGNMAPINGALMSVVDEELRAYAMGFSITAIHLLGDFPSPFIIGIMKDRLGIATAMVLLNLVNLLTYICWQIADILLVRKVRVMTANHPEMAYSKLG